MWIHTQVLVRPFSLPFVDQTGFRRWILVSFCIWLLELLFILRKCCYFSQTTFFFFLLQWMTSFAQNVVVWKATWCAWPGSNVESRISVAWACNLQKQKPAQTLAVFSKTFGSASLCSPNQSRRTGSETATFSLSACRKVRFCVFVWLFWTQTQHTQHTRSRKVELLALVSEILVFESDACKVCLFSSLVNVFVWLVCTHKHSLSCAVFVGDSEVCSFAIWFTQSDILHGICARVPRHSLAFFLYFAFCVATSTVCVSWTRVCTTASRCFSVRTGMWLLFVLSVCCVCALTHNQQTKTGRFVFGHCGCADNATCAGQWRWTTMHYETVFVLSLSFVCCVFWCCYVVCIVFICVVVLVIIHYLLLISTSTHGSACRSLTLRLHCQQTQSQTRRSKANTLQMQLRMRRTNRRRVLQNYKHMLLLSRKGKTAHSKQQCK